MGDLNLDFDVGTKKISLGDNSSDNLGFIKENENSNFELDISDNNILPNLTASDGVELLVKGKIIHQKMEDVIIIKKQKRRF